MFSFRIILLPVFLFLWGVHPVLGQDNPNINYKYGKVVELYGDTIFPDCPSDTFCITKIGLPINFETGTLAPKSSYNLSLNLTTQLFQSGHQIYTNTYFEPCCNEFALLPPIFAPPKYSGPGYNVVTWAFDWVLTPEDQNLKGGLAIIIETQDPGCDVLPELMVNWGLTDMSSNETIYLNEDNNLLLPHLSFVQTAMDSAEALFNCMPIINPD